MGWIRDGAYGHEGWVANVLADGRVTGSSTDSGVIVNELTADDIVAEREVRRYPGTDHVDVVIPWDQVMTWRGTCACGWTGPHLPAYDDTTCGTRACPDAVQEHDFYPAWSAHVAPYVALFELDGMTDQLHNLEQQIAEKVQLARTAGASWTQIGQATGLTKQGAQQRWSQL